MESYESYVVRIYRRPTASEEPLVGVVEVVGEARRHVFHGPEELIRILTKAQKRERDKK